VNGPLLFATIVVAVAWTFGVVATGTWRQWHHYHIGTPFVLLALGGVVPLWVGWVALAVQFDDAVNHCGAILDPDYRSPLHLAYRHFLYEPWVRWRARK
jgi:hypothetical protein